MSRASLSGLDASRRPPTHLYHDLSEVTRVFWEYYNDWRPVTIRPYGLEHENPRFVDTNPGSYGVFLERRLLIIVCQQKLHTSKSKLEMRGLSGFHWLNKWIENLPSVSFMF